MPETLDQLVSRAGAMANDVGRREKELAELRTRLSDLNHQIRCTRALHRATYQGEQQDPMFVEAFGIWENYYRVTEEYDRTVCRTLRDGVAWPTTAEERRLVSANAQLRTTEASLRVTQAHIPFEVSRRARAAACDKDARRR